MSIIVIAGPPLAGKTTAAHQMANELGYTAFIHDDIVSEFIPESDRELEDRIRCYDEMHRRAREAITRGQSIILEGTYSRKEYRESFQKFNLGDTIHLIEIHISPEEALERFAQRTGHSGINNTKEIIEDRARNYPYLIEDTLTGKRVNVDDWVSALK